MNLAQTHENIFGNLPVPVLLTGQLTAVHTPEKNTLLIPAAAEMEPLKPALHVQPVGIEIPELQSKLFTKQ